MSGLDEIVCDHRAFVADILQERMPKGKPILTEELVTIDRKAKQQIKELFLELIGENELVEDHEIIKAFGGKRRDVTEANVRRLKNRWKAELRQMLITAI